MNREFKLELRLIGLSKSINVALTKGDLTAARAIYHQMSDQGKSAAMTQYLVYKLALQEKDAELGTYLSSCASLSPLTILATKSLEGILKSSSKDSQKYLYACALEAQQIGDRKQFIATLNKILELHEKHSLSDVRLAVLLRFVREWSTFVMVLTVHSCIVGSIETELKNNNMPLEAGLTELCKVFEAGIVTEVKARVRTNADLNSHETWKQFQRRGRQ